MEKYIVWDAENDGDDVAFEAETHAEAAEDYARQLHNKYESTENTIGVYRSDKSREQARFYFVEAEVEVTFTSFRVDDPRKAAG